MKTLAIEAPTERELEKIVNMSNHQVLMLWERMERLALIGHFVSDELWDAVREELCQRNINPDMVTITYADCDHTEEMFTLVFVALGGNIAELCLIQAGEQEDPFFLRGAKCSVCEPEAKRKLDDVLISTLIKQR